MEPETIVNMLFCYVTEVLIIKLLKKIFVDKFINLLKILRYKLPEAHLIRIFGK